jgi:hypothetical protein
MERERSAHASLEETAEPAANPADLPRLIGQARTVEGLDRFKVAEKINSLLIAMRAPGNEAAEAKAILAELDVSSLDGLVDGHGRDCRKEAVETLLACGFPHALNVAPEDLEHMRDTAEGRQRIVIEPNESAPGAWSIPKEGSFLVNIGALVQLGAAIQDYPASPVFAAIAGIGALLAFTGSAFLRKLRLTESPTIPISLLSAGAAAGVLGATGPGTTVWNAATGLTSTLVILLILLARDKDES